MSTQPYIVYTLIYRQFRTMTLLTYARMRIVNCWSFSFYEGDQITAVVIFSLIFFSSFIRLFFVLAGETEMRSFFKIYS